MINRDYLRQQARLCLQIADNCFDLTAAERLRLMATDFVAKAEQENEEDGVPPYMHGGRHYSSRHMDLD